MILHTSGPCHDACDADTDICPAPEDPPENDPPPEGLRAIRGREQDPVLKYSQTQSFWLK